MFEHLSRLNTLPAALERDKQIGERLNILETTYKTGLRLIDDLRQQKQITGVYDPALLEWPIGQNSPSTEALNVVRDLLPSIAPQNETPFMLQPYQPVASEPVRASAPVKSQVAQAIETGPALSLMDLLQEASKDASTVQVSTGDFNYDAADLRDEPVVKVSGGELVVDFGYDGESFDVELSVDDLLDSDFDALLPREQAVMAEYLLDTGDSDAQLETNNKREEFDIATYQLGDL